MGSGESMINVQLRIKNVSYSLSLRMDTRSLSSFEKDSQFLDVSPSFDMTRKELRTEN